MIDPFTALGTVSSILEFIDFGSKLLIHGYGLYKSTEGATMEVLRVEELTVELQSLMSGLMGTKSGSSKPMMNDVTTQKLANMGYRFAQELLNILQDLKVKPTTRYKSWESLRQALRKQMKKAKIDGMQEELAKIHRLLNTHLLSMLR